MIITRLERIGKYKYLIEFEDGCRCEIKESVRIRMDIEVGKDMTLPDRDSLFRNILLPQAKEYLLRSLTSSDKTRAQLLSGLKRKHMPDDVIEEALSYIDNYGFIDDRRFAVHFIDSRKGSKSREYIRQSLIEKGVNSHVIDDLMSDYDIREEISVIEKKVKSCFKGKQDISRKDMDKLAASLMRQGFDRNNIYKCVYISEHTDIEG